MKTQSSIIGLVVLALALGSIGYTFYTSSMEQRKADIKDQVKVTNFEECAQAGNPIMESYPRQCKAGGQTFTEDVPSPVTAPAPQPQPEAVASSTSLSDMITVTSPTSGSKVKSPLQVTGKARGTWYFEASFPVMLVDADGKTLAQVPAHAQGEWMTTEFVPFTVTLPWTKTTATSGTLILKKDNPSGLPQNEKEIRIPVTF